MKPKSLLFLTLVLAAGFVLRINNLSSRSLWTDEFFTLFQSSGHGNQVKGLMDSLAKEPRPVMAVEFKRLMKADKSKGSGDVLSGLLRTDTHPPFYFLVMHFWMWAFSDTAQALRFFSVLCGVASILLAFKLGKRLFDGQAGFFCALFVSLSAFCVRYSQEARSYSLIICIGLASFLILLSMESKGRKRDGVLFSLLTALGLYTHYFYSLIACSQFIYFTLAQRKDDKRMNRFYLSFLWGLLLFSPWFIIVNLKGYNYYLTEWVFGYQGVTDKLASFFYGFARYLFIFDKPGFVLSVLLWLFLFWFAFNFLAATRRMLKLQPGRGLLSLCMFILPLLALLSLDLIEKGALLRQERFWAFGIPGFSMLAGYTLSYAFDRNRILTVIFIAGMCYSSFFVSALNFGPAPKRASEWINRLDNDGKTCVLIYNIRSAVAGQAYYLNDRVWLFPVAKEEQLPPALRRVSGFAGKVFVARQYHRTDPALMDMPFMAEDHIERGGFRLLGSADMDDVGVFEYTRI